MWKGPLARNLKSVISVHHAQRSCQTPFYRPEGRRVSSETVYKRAAANPFRRWATRCAKSKNSPRPMARMVCRNLLKCTQFCSATDMFLPIQKGHCDWERVLTKMLHQIDARSDIIMRTGGQHLAGTKWQTANAVVAAPFGSELPGAVARTKCQRH